MATHTYLRACNKFFEQGFLSHEKIESMDIRDSDHFFGTKPVSTLLDHLGHQGSIFRAPWITDKTCEVAPPRVDAHKRQTAKVIYIRFNTRPGLFAPSRGTQGKKSVLDNP